MDHTGMGWPRGTKQANGASKSAHEGSSGSWKQDHDKPDIDHYVEMRHLWDMPPAKRMNYEG